ncbi:hypothetical protein H0H92_003741 [Tricholoma furcatifolium]|nr:hypothetical protein H0H92_003741 [Tricholoma furcatifolium]
MDAIESEDGKTALPPERDTLYYWTNIEDTLFRIPKDALVTNSRVFQDLFTVPQGDDTPLEGSSDSHPIELPIILPIDIPARKISKDGWIAVLRIATLWEMNKIRRHAINMLTVMSLGSIEKIVLAKKFHIPEWLRAGYSELVDQHEMPSLSDCEEIGLLSAICIYQLREQRQIDSRSRFHVPSYDNNINVETVFEKELAAEENFSRTYAADLEDMRPDSQASMVGTPIYAGSE